MTQDDQPTPPPREPDPAGDAIRLTQTVHRHDDAGGFVLDQSGEIAGITHAAILAVAGRRIRRFIEADGTLRKTATPGQLEELERLCTAAWVDGFAVGARAQQEQEHRT